MSYRLTSLALAAAAALSLTACGGGGGGGSEPSQGPAPSVAAPAPTTTTTTAPTATAQSVKLVGLELKASDMLVQTAASSIKVSAAIGQLFTDLFPSAHAAVQDKLNPGANFGFTNKVKDGMIVSLGVKLQASDGSPLNCDASTAEIKINRAWRVHRAQEHVLIDAEVPSTVNADCSVTYSNGLYTVSAAGVVSRISVADESVVRVLEAGNPGSNSSDKTLLIFNNGLVRTVEIDSASVTTIRDLNDKNLPLNLSIDNTVAFNGNTLVGIPADRKDAVLAFDASSKAFKIINTTMSTGTVLPPSGYTTQVFLTAENTFVWFEWGSTARELDIASGTYTPWAPAQRRATMIPGNPTATEGGVPAGMYGFNGRWNQYVQSDRCMIWNYATNEAINLAEPTAPSAPATATSIAFSKLENGYGYCVSGAGNLFSRVNMATKAIAYFDTDKLGFYNSASRKTEMYADRAVLWDTVSTSTSDVRVMELNFETGAVVDRGIISVGDRKVVQFVPIG